MESVRERTSSVRADIDKLHGQDIGVCLAAEKEGRCFVLQTSSNEVAECFYTKSLNDALLK